MHSAVFANNPTAAGALACMVLQGRISRCRQAEVMDLDEEAYRLDLIAPRLFGYLRAPVAAGLVQNQKVASGLGELADQESIAEWMMETMEPGTLYILGPGSTTAVLAKRLGLEKTLVGVDVVKDGRLVLKDANERRLLELLEGRGAKIVVTPIGGQGHIFGRGNQQIRDQVIEKVGRDCLLVLCTPEKLHALHSRPLLVDTGDSALDEMLGGFIRVVTGYGEWAVYRVDR
jgi:predicted polyphosphate/ATP-dependent NAD kinase